MSKEWDEMWADVDQHACKVCGVYKCSTHLADEWVVCPGCPNQTKYWLKYHGRCPNCGTEPPVPDHQSSKR